MSFEELGLVFRQERERRGLSLEEVAGRLKLMPRIVRAIEQADIEELPQAVYARGFVKAYASLLELNPELIHEGIEDAWPDDFQQAQPPYEAIGERKSGAKGLIATLAIVALALAAGSGLWFFHDLDLSLSPDAPSKAEPAISAKSEALPPQNQNRSIPAAGNKNQLTARQTSPPAPAAPPVAANQPAPPVEAAGGSRVEENASGMARRDSSPPASAAQDDRQHNLIIIALAECWIHSNADSTDTRQFSLRKGDTFALTFSKKLVLKLGNAGGVRIRLDGRELDPPGEMGQVKTLTFPTTP